MVYHVAGLMSGTSLDGLDIALCVFTEHAQGWSYQLAHGETIPFPDGLADGLRDAHLASGAQLASLDAFFARWCGEQLRKLVASGNFSPLLVASHGHTVFHQPAAGFTLQIGNGSVLAAACGLPVVSDFRSSDIALGGEGAPLVPVGDELLFGSYAACLNLGGIANISHRVNGHRIAYDIVPVNMVLNHLAIRLGHPFDPEGAFASRGSMQPDLLNQLSSSSYYRKAPPKSLGREWVEREIIPLLKHSIKPEDLLHTYSAHAAHEIAKAIPGNPGDRLLVTGGGAHNQYLMNLIQSQVKPIIEVPSRSIADYKEAMVFGFLGLLRWLGRTNVLSSVTGATRDHCSGQIAIP
jgi:anhydro-N-acetylmuramic acid kinase